MGVLNTHGWEVYENNNLFQVGTTRIRSGAGSGRFAATGTATSSGTLVGANGTSYNAATVTTRFYVYFRTLPATGFEAFARFNAAGSKAYLLISSAGVVSVGGPSNATLTGGAGTASLVANRWYRVEAQIGTGTSAAFAARVYDERSGALLDSISGTGNLGTGNHINIALGKSFDYSGQTVDYWFDDVVIRDDTTWPGEGRGQILGLCANGTNAGWTGNVGDVDSSALDSDTSYLSAATSGLAHTFTLRKTTTSGIIGTGHIVKVAAVARVEVDGPVMALRVRTNGSVVDTPFSDISTSYVARGVVMALNPVTGLAWTSAELDALEIGVVFVSGTGVIRVSTLYCYVDYLPSAGSGGGASGIKRVGFEGGF